MLKQWIKVEKLDLLKNASYVAFEKFFLGAERQEGKIRKCLFFYVKIF